MKAVYLRCGSEVAPVLVAPVPRVRAFGNNNNKVAPVHVAVRVTRVISVHVVQLVLAGISGEAQVGESGDMM